MRQSQANFHSARSQFAPARTPGRASGCGSSASLEGPRVNSVEAKSWLGNGLDGVRIGRRAPCDNVTAGKKGKNLQVTSYKWPRHNPAAMGRFGLVMARF